MKQKNRKKGFSLIELIVVIAVIAAIAAVIVPQFSNMTGAAKTSADQRNVQLWNETYANAAAMDQSALNGTTLTDPTKLDGASSVDPINAVYDVGETQVTFKTDGFTLKAGTVKWDADTNTLNYTATK